MRIFLLSVALEWHRNLNRRSLELRGEVAEARNAFNKVDVGVEGHDSATCIIELSPP